MYSSKRLKAIHKWDGLKSLVMVNAEVERNNKVTTETKYYITSLTCSAKKIADSISLNIS